MLNAEFRSAMLSECGTYRYTLGRIWDFDKPRVLFIMLHPGTANQHQDDPAINRCRMVAQREGFGGMFIGNLFAYRVGEPTDLRALWIRGLDVVGPNNDTSLDHLAGMCELTVFCWGTYGELAGRGDMIMRKFNNAVVFGFTGNSNPRHILHVSKEAPLIQTKRHIYF